MRHGVQQNRQLGLGCMEQTAIFSPCRTWRYTLHRQWGEGAGVIFLMFNPSTADEAADDPTIRKCRGFARRWGFGRMLILNLFAVRGTDPRIVRQVADPIGPDNDLHIWKMTGEFAKLVCAWGCGSHMRGELVKRPGTVVEMVQEARPTLLVECLGYSKDGSPRHPLMLAYDAKLEKYEVGR